MPCVQVKPASLKFSDKRSALVQLMVFLDETGDNKKLSAASIFSYRSLMMFRLADSIPFNYLDSLSILRSLAPRMVIAGISHPDSASPGKYFTISNDSKQTISIQYNLTASELKQMSQRNRRFGKTMRQLGCWPLKTMIRKHGSNHHYAGTIPYNAQGVPFTLLPSGQLSNAKNVFVADGSGFRFLPAKGLTFTLMANAHRTALNAMKDD
jgi:hypothetical protein